MKTKTKAAKATTKASAKAPKTHRFIIDVETHQSRRVAEIHVLCAFAARGPDDCRFKLQKKPPQNPVTKSELAAAFTEWERRYREEPDRFMSEASKLLKETPETYGEACAPYLLEILSEIRGVKGSAFTI